MNIPVLLYLCLYCTLYFQLLFVSLTRHHTSLSIKTLYCVCLSNMPTNNRAELKVADEH